MPVGIRFCHPRRQQSCSRRQSRYLTHGRGERIRFAVALTSCVVLVDDLTRGGESFWFLAHSDWIGDLELDASGDLLATVSSDNRARLWPMDPHHFFAEAVERARADPAVRARLAKARGD